MARKLIGVLAGLVLLGVLTAALALLFAGLPKARQQAPAAMAPTPSATAAPKAAPTPPEPRPSPGTPQPPSERRTPGPAISPYTPTPVRVVGPVVNIDIPGKEFGKYSPASKVIVSAVWGKAEGEYGLQLTSARAGAPGFGVDGSAYIYVLDGLNSRVHKYDAKGTRVATYPVDLAHEIAVRNDGGFYLLDVARDFVVRAYSPIGKLETTYAINKELGNYPIGIVGLSALAERVYLALGNGAYTLIVSDGKAIPPEAQASNQLPGRPSRVTDRFLLTQRVGETSAITKVFRADGTLESQVQVALERRLAAPYVETDDKGNIFFCGVLIKEAGIPRGETLAAQRVVVAFTPQGQFVGKVEMPDIYLTEATRPVMVAPEGNIYQRQTSQEGVKIVKWELER